MHANESPRDEMLQPPVTVIEWVGPAGSGTLRLLDQTQLPGKTSYVDCNDRHSVRQAIRKLVVRGAPAIGVAAGYGMVVAAQNLDDCADFISRLESVAEYLEGSRPTAVNLAWAVRRVLDRAEQADTDDCVLIRKVMLEEARAIHTEDCRMCQAIGEHAAPLVQRCRNVLTHCNAGALATAGIGTATAGMYVAHARGHRFGVFCDETRPLLQGSRLTAWELQKAGIDARVITDNAAAHILAQGDVQAVIVGADRIAANGDVANKIGTYGLALAARYHNVPFYVAAPYSTFDLTLQSGKDIPIEYRDGEEITNGFGSRTAPRQIGTVSPAFDVTPADLVTAIVTDRGMIEPVNSQTIKKHLA